MNDGVCDTSATKLLHATRGILTASVSPHSIPQELFHERAGSGAAGRAYISVIEEFVFVRMEYRVCFAVLTAVSASMARITAY